MFRVFQIWASPAYGRMGECKRLMLPRPYQVQKHPHGLFFVDTVMMKVHGKHDYHCNWFIIIARLRLFCFSAQLTYLFFLLPRAKHLSEPRETEPLGSDLAGLEEHRHPHHHRLLCHQQCPRHHLRRSLPPPSPHQQLFLGNLYFFILNRKSGMECSRKYLMNKKNVSLTERINFRSALPLPTSLWLFLRWPSRYWRQYISWHELITSVSNCIWTVLELRLDIKLYNTSAHKIRSLLYETVLEEFYLWSNTSK